MSSTWANYCRSSNRARQKIYLRLNFKIFFWTKNTISLVWKKIFGGDWTSSNNNSWLNLIQEMEKLFLLSFYFIWSKKVCYVPFLCQVLIFLEKETILKIWKQKNLLRTKNLILIFNPLFGPEKYLFDPSQQTSNKSGELDAIPYS